jgi:hypothetical protein
MFEAGCRLNSTPSIPTDPHISHRAATSGSVVDGHSVHGAVSRRAAPVGPGGRVGARQPQKVEGDEVRRPQVRCPGSTGAAAMQPASTSLLAGEGHAAVIGMRSR